MTQKKKTKLKEDLKAFMKEAAAVTVVLTAVAGMALTYNMTAEGCRMTLEENGWIAPPPTELEKLQNREQELLKQLEAVRQEQQKINTNDEITK